MESFHELREASEVARCPACEQDGANAALVVVARPHVFRDRAEFSVRSCRRCGAVFTSPRLSAPALSDWYEALRDRAAAVGSLPSERGARSRLPSALLEVWRRAEHQHSPALQWIARGPVLDLGCGSGALLKQLAALKIEAEGVEWNRDAVAKAQRQGLRVVQADVGGYEPPTAKYQHIVLSHVAEHLPDPAAELRRFAPALASGGSFIIAVPNAGSALRYVFGRHWVGWDVPFHLTHFTRSSMDRIASRAGLRVRRYSTQGTAEELRRSLNHALGKSWGLLPLRVAFLPMAKVLGALGVGSVLLAELVREQDTAT